MQNPPKQGEYRIAQCINDPSGLSAVSEFNLGTEQSETQLLSLQWDVQFGVLQHDASPVPNFDGIAHNIQVRLRQGQLVWWGEPQTQQVALLVWVGAVIDEFITSMQDRMVGEKLDVA